MAQKVSTFQPIKRIWSCLWFFNIWLQNGSLLLVSYYLTEGSARVRVGKTDKNRSFSFFSVFKQNFRDFLLKFAVFKLKMLRKRHFLVKNDAFWFKKMKFWTFVVLNAGASLLRRNTLVLWMLFWTTCPRPSLPTYDSIRMERQYLIFGSELATIWIAQEKLLHVRMPHSVVELVFLLIFDSRIFIREKIWSFEK